MYMFPSLAVSSVGGGGGRPGGMGIRKLFETIFMIFSRGTTAQTFTTFNSNLTSSRLKWCTYRDSLTRFLGSGFFINLFLLVPIEVPQSAFENKNPRILPYVCVLCMSFQLLQLMPSPNSPIIPANPQVWNGSPRILSFGELGPFRVHIHQHRQTA